MLPGEEYVGGTVGVTVVWLYEQSTPHCLLGEEQVFGLSDRVVFAVTVSPALHVLPTVEGFGTYVQSTPHCLFVFGDEQVFGVLDRVVLATTVVPVGHVLPTVEGLLLLEHAP